MMPSEQKRPALVLGDRDGVPGIKIARCLAALGITVLRAESECFACNPFDAVDPPLQQSLLDAYLAHCAALHQQSGSAVSSHAAACMLVLGNHEADAARNAALTFFSGDPLGLGPLTGRALGLPAYHILEFRAALPPQLFAREIAPHLPRIEAAVLAALRQLRSADD